MGANFDKLGLNDRAMVTRYTDDLLGRSVLGPEGFRDVTGPVFLARPQGMNDDQFVAFARETIGEGLASSTGALDAVRSWNTRLNQDMKRVKAETNREEQVERNFTARFGTRRDFGPE